MHDMLGLTKGPGRYRTGPVFVHNDRLLPGPGRGRCAFLESRARASIWIKFSLRAHHMQAQMHVRRIEFATRLGHEISEIVAEHGLPERTPNAPSTRCTKRRSASRSGADGTWRTASTNARRAGI